MFTHRSAGESEEDPPSAAGDATVWSFDPETGLLASKTDAEGRVTEYRYNDLGLLAKRTDARGWVTDYRYDTRGLLDHVDYQGTAATTTTDLVYTYDRAGKQTTVTDAAGQRSFTYYETWSGSGDRLSKSGRLKSETLPAAYGGHVLTYDYQYDIAGRANGLPAGFRLGTGTAYRMTYGYDDRLRLQSVQYNDHQPFSYTYVPGSNLIDLVSQDTGSSTYTYRRDYDYRVNSNRLDTMTHAWAGTAAKAVETRLDYNTLGLRITEQTSGSAYMNLLGRSGEFGVHADYLYTDRYEIESSGKYVLPTDWLVGAARSGSGREYAFDDMGNRTSAVTGATTATYQPDNLNQYASITGLGVLTYDQNGNLTHDGTRTYAYDAENRLISITEGSNVWQYRYDYLGRRISKVGPGVSQKFLYDGWNLIAELNSSGTLTRRFAWGLDVSGSLQGAGGIGGLLVINTGSSGGSIYQPIYDASHNVIGLYDGSGNLAAAYEYDPFGNLQTSAGTYSGSNPFRSATKYTDAETGFAYYGLRYYAPLLGRFLNRDPIEEEGGLNLYAFCGNDGVNRWDYLGMEWWNPFSWFSSESGSSSVEGDFADQTVSMDPFVTNSGESGSGESTDSSPTRFGPHHSSDQYAKEQAINDVNGSTSAPTSLARDANGAGGSLPALTQAQVDEVWGAWGKYVKIHVPGMRIADGGKGRDIVDANIAQLKMLVAQAVRFRRSNGDPAIAMQQVVQGLLANGAGKQITLGFGLGNGTIHENGRIFVTIERSSDVQMVVSIMHEFLHAVDYMGVKTRLDKAAIENTARHDEIYRLQNQTLYDLTGMVDGSYRGHQIADPYRYTGP